MMFGLAPRVASTTCSKVFPLLRQCAICKRCTTVLVQVQTARCYSEQRPPTTDHSATVCSPWRLHMHVSQGQYGDALDLWEKAKQLGHVTPALYPSILRLCEKIGSAEAARAVRDDMLAQGWKMDKICSLHFVGALLSEGLAEEALQFMTSSDLMGDTELLTKSAQVFCSYGYFHQACSVCHLGSDPSLVTLEVEILGHLNRADAARELVEKNYGDISSAPAEVQVAMANCFSLANNPEEAMKTLTQLVANSAHVPVKSLTLLMESVHRLQDFNMAAQVFSDLWEKIVPATELVMKDASTASQGWYQYHLRAVNAAIGLQAFALRDIKSSSEVSKELQRLLQYNFLSQQLARLNGFTPDGQTYAALLLLFCFFKEGSRSVLTRALKNCVRNGVVVEPDHFTWWTKYCGMLPPSQAERVLNWMFVHSHAYRVPLEADQYKQLLSISYDTGDSQSQKEALACVTMIRRKIKTPTTELYNLVMSAQGRLGGVRDMYWTYSDMLKAGAKPDIQTYHILVDGNLKEGSERSAKAGAYDVWRLLVRQSPGLQPDVAVLCKLIRCCRLCQDYRRAFFFLRIMNEYGLQPDLETFEELLKVCRAAQDMGKFEVVVALANQCLPHEEWATINNIAAGIEREWRTKEDLSTVMDLVSHMDTTHTLSGHGEDDVLLQH